MGMAPLHGKLQRYGVVVSVVVEHAQRFLLEQAGSEDGRAQIEATRGCGGTSFVGRGGMRDRFMGPRKKCIKMSC